MLSSDFVKIGEVGVDSGQLMVIDPCYLIGYPMTEKNRQKIFDKIYGKNGEGEGYGQVVNDLGLAFFSGFGDGIYDVYAKYDGKSIVGLFIDMGMIDDEGDEEDENE